MMTFAKAMENAEALKSLGQHTVYLSDMNDDPATFPWEHVTSVESGNLHGWTGVRSVNLLAELDNGLTFHWSVDFSEYEPGDRDQFKSYFDRHRLVEMANKLPASARKQFAAFLEDDVAPKLNECTDKVLVDLGRLRAGQEVVSLLIAMGENE